MISEQTLSVLGQLQADPESSQAWDKLTGFVSTVSEGDDQRELSRLLRSAIAPHRERGEWWAVVKLLELALPISRSIEERQALLEELARVRRDELTDEAGATKVYRELLELVPGFPTAVQALAEHDERAARWRDLASTYAQEAESATDDVYRSSMLMRAAEMELRFASETEDRERVIERLEQAVRLDATNVQAGLMLERCHRLAGNWEEVVRVLDRLASRATDSAVRVAASVRLARVHRYRLEDVERAAVAYERLLRDATGHAEAMEFLSQLYSSEERWDELVALYERDLKTRNLNSPEVVGDMLQIAMLHHKKRERPEDAEPWFERIRRIQPAHESVLAFFREFCKNIGDESRWIEVLQGAQYAMPDGRDKATIVTELAELAEQQADMQRAIEQYKGVLRQDPDSEMARDALKRLYKATQGFTALVELLRQQLERTPAEEYAKRLAILREVAGVYRQYIRSDASLVTVLHQIVQLDEKVDANDVEELRELVMLYERLGRHRELLTYQLKLAELTSDVEEKKNLYRAAARRWLEQFSNYQNATEAYEALLAVDPDDVEALDRLNELYRRRRTWGPLFDLLAREAAKKPKGQRTTLLKEMAQLASERLHKPDDAVQLFRQILDEDEERVEVLDALEKHAERSKDWATLAYALERRVGLAPDDASRIAVLQKLGSVYSDHLADSSSSIKAWCRVLELQAGHPRALRVLRDAYLQAANYDALNDLYASQNDWEGLVEVLSNTADRITDGSLKTQLSYRAAAIYTDKLGQPERAARSYERILSVDPTDVRAATALVPIYEVDEKWSRLPALYELLLTTTQDPKERMVLFGKLVDVTGQRLLDKKSAAAHARRAWSEFPTEDVICEQFENATRAAGAWEAYLEALQERLSALVSAPAPAEPTPAEAGAAFPEAETETKTKKKGKKKGKREEQESKPELAAPDVVKPEPAKPEPVAAAPSASELERRSIELRLAKTLAQELGRLDDAIQTYQRILTQLPNDLEVQALLSDLLRSNGRLEQIRWLWDHRVNYAESPTLRIEYLLNSALFEERELSDVNRAIETYRKVLAIDESHSSALLTLQRLLLAEKRLAEAAAVIEKRRDLASGQDRVELELTLAELYLTSLSRPEDALATAIRVLDSVGQEPRAISIVERTLDVESVRKAAAEVLVRRFASAGEARRAAQAMSVLLESAPEREERLSLVNQLIHLHADRLGEQSAALDVALRTLTDYPDESALWDRAEELASGAGRPTDLAECLRGVLSVKLPRDLDLSLCERAARLHEERLGDPVGATPYLERMLVLEPDNERAFGRLKDILTAAERWGELEAMYERAIELIEDRTRRIEMLSEVALIAEEIVGDPVKAMRHNERILQIDPLHPAALETLDQLYTRHERFEPLAELLNRRLEIATEEEATELKRRAAFILLDKLHEPDKAIGHVEDLLQKNVNDFDARTLAERLLGIKTLRARMARTLETVYETRDEMRDLVRVLSIRLDCLDDVDQPESNERRDLLRRIAVLRDERLHDDDGAFEVLQKLVPLDPEDGDARTRLVEIGRRLGRVSDIVEVLRKAFDATRVIPLRAEIGMQLAQIEQAQLSDIAAAEMTYRRIVALDPQNPSVTLPAAHALEKIYQATHQSSALADNLRLQVRLVATSEERSELLRRLGQLCRDAIGDIDAAIIAYRSCLDEDARDEAALEALDELLERARRYSELADILLRRHECSTQPAQRRELAIRRAHVLAEQLSDLLGAIEAWRKVVEEFGADGETMTALAQLFEQQKSWLELAECLEQHVDLTTNNEERLELLVRLGNVRHARLSDPQGALDAYRRALTVDTRHEPTRSALLGLLDEPEVFVRREAARTLHPVFASEQNGASLLRVLQIEVDSEDDPATRLDLLLDAMNVAERQLGDMPKAFGYAVRGTREALRHSELSSWLEHLDRLAAGAGMQAQQVELLREIVTDIFDGDVQLSVTLKIATMARDQLSDLKLAQEFFEKALEIRPDDRTALQALEQLHERQGDAARLLEVVGRRVEVAESDEERKTLMLRQARLLSEKLGEVSRAIEVFERIVDLDFDAVAVDELERLYRSESRWDALVSLLQRRLEAHRAPHAPLLVSIADVFATHIQNVPRALDELESALSAEPDNAAAVALLERLLETNKDVELRARTGALLEPVYNRRGDQRRVMVALQARLDASSAPDERRELLSRIAKIHEEQAEDYPAALETMAQLLHEDLADQHVRSELERLAKVANAEKRLADIYATELEAVTTDDASTAELAARSGQLFEAQGDLERSLAHYRRALAFNPEDAGLFAAIDAILVKKGSHAERIELYRSSLEHRFDTEERLRALHMIASLQHYIGESTAAINTLREALDVDERDARTLDALTDLYGREKRWDDLAELLQRRSEQLLDPAESSVYRIQLVKLLLDEIKSSSRAIDQLEEIVRLVPDHREAIGLLEQLRMRPDCKERVGEILRPIYEAADDWQSIIRLNEDRFELATASSDKVAVLRETAELYEKRGKDPERARQAILFAIEADPEDIDVRVELERLTQVTGQWDELANTYEKMLEEQTVIAGRRDIIAVLAKTYDQHLDNPRKALASYWRLLDAEPGDLETLDQIERLATLLSDWSQLVRALVIKADLLLGDEERAYSWRRIGEARRDMLDDPAGAIDAYEHALELNPASGFTVDCLLELLETRGAPERRVELLVRRVELCDDEDADRKFELLTTAATVFETELKERGRAIDLLTSALALRPGDRGVLGRLEVLYEAERLWGDLLDNLRTMAELSTDPSERGKMRGKMARILARETGSFDEALDCYRQVLEDVPNDEEAISAAFEIGREHEDLRESAAGIMVPVLTSSGKMDRLVEVLELRLTVEHEPSVRVETLRAIAEIAEQRLSKPALALDAVLRAMSEMPEETALFNEVERLATLVEDGYRRVADVLEERASATFDPEIVRELSVRLGQIAETKLSQPLRAVSAYRRAVEQTGDRPELLAALDRLYVHLQDFSALADVLERRASVEETAEAVADCYYRLARLQLDQFGQAGTALATARSALERVSDHAGTVELLETLSDRRELFEEVSELLEGVYRNTGRTDRLAGLYEKKVAQAEGQEERLEMRRALSHVLEDDCRDPVAACRVLGDGLAEDPSDPLLVEELERLMAITGAWSDMASKLAAAVDAKTELPHDIRRDLWQKAAIWFRDRAGDPTQAEIVLIKALGCDPNNDEVLTQIEALRRVPGRERDLVEILRLRGRGAMDEEQRIGLFREAKQIAANLSDAALVEAIVREVLSLDDRNIWALSELTELRRSMGDYAETFKLLSRQIDIEVEDARLRQLRHDAARVARDELKLPDKAIEIYTVLFEDDATDGVAAEALRNLLQSQGRLPDLSRVLERLIDVAVTPAERSGLRLELARLNESLGKDAEAVEMLRAVLDDEPNHAEAVISLSRLYEKTGQDMELAELLERQIESARERGDTKVEIELQLRIAEVAERRLSDIGRAVRTYRSILERVVAHRGALEALARIYAAQSDREELAQVLVQLVDSSTGEERIGYSERLADARLELGDRAGAAEALVIGLSVNERNAALRARLRGLYEQLEDWGKVSGLIAQEAALAAAVPEQVRLLREAATIRAERLSDPAGAADLLAHASSLAPEDRELLLVLCDAYSQSGRGDKAAETLERIVASYGGRRSKELGEIHRRLGEAYWAQGGAERAKEEFEKAFRIEPGNVKVIARLGEVCLAIGDAKRAQQLYSSLIIQIPKLDPNGPINKALIYSRRGEASRLLGERDKAKQDYERALQADPRMDWVRERLAELKG
ncbi:MAG TPA: tetratricopeptide repeat protein [Polyangiaceae bacterium]|nr:tetratricopeptide repeat protein [Polyangiaceae bacterium]